VENATKIWLKHAPQRVKIISARDEKRREASIQD